MYIRSPFCISFSGITIRFIPPAPMQLSPAFEALLCADTGNPDAEYEIQLLHKPLTFDILPTRRYQGATIYRTREGWLRISPLQPAEDGCQVACLLRPNNKNVLYYPASMWEHFASPLHCAHLMGLETLLLQHNAFLLHSSVVTMNGKAVLFSGPSGCGKSTQADLWAKYLGADILNGDRCVVMKKSDGFYGGGSPLAGHSGIYRREQAPIAGIFLVNQAEENSLQRLGFQAFAPLFSQTLVNAWDSDFMQTITTLYQELLSSIPIYRLNCRADEGAVQTAYNALF